MQERGLRITGIILVVIGIILIFNSFSNITSYVVYEDVPQGVGSVVGIIIVIGGAILMSMKRQEAYRARESKLKELTCKERFDSLPEKEKRQYNSSYRRYLERIGKKADEPPQENINERVNEITIEYQLKRIDYVTAAEEFRKLGRITGMKYRPPKQFSIYLEGIRYRLPNIKEDEDLAVEIFRRIPDIYKDNAELHGGKNLSTKHHKKGLNKKASK